MNREANKRLGTHHSLCEAQQQFLVPLFSGQTRGKGVVEQWVWPVAWACSSPTGCTTVRVETVTAGAHELRNHCIGSHELVWPARPNLRGLADQATHPSASLPLHSTVYTCACFHSCTLLSRLLQVAPALDQLLPRALVGRSQQHSRVEVGCTT